MAALVLAALACLGPAPARAGHYAITYSASIPANGQATPLIPINSGPNPFYDYGNSHASATTTLNVNAKAVWVSNGPGDVAPPSQAFLETFSAFGVEGTTGGSVTVSDGAPDNPVSASWPIYYNGVMIQDTVQDTADGQHLWVGVGASISLPQVTMTVTFSGGAVGTIGLCYAASTVSGGWAGPYYFHYGRRYIGNTFIPWENNTAGPTPTFTDVADITYAFPVSENGCISCQTEGTITPVWYWTGPSGMYPPDFDYDVTSESLTATNVQNDIRESIVVDGLGNTGVSMPPNINEVRDYGSYTATIEPDNYVPDEGPTYWAIGQPIQNLDALITSANPDYLTAEVEAYAVITNGLIGD